MSLGQQCPPHTGVHVWHTNKSSMLRKQPSKKKKKTAPVDPEPANQKTVLILFLLLWFKRSIRLTLCFVIFLPNLCFWKKSLFLGWKIRLRKAATCLLFFLSNLKLEEFCPKQERWKVTEWLTVNCSWTSTCKHKSIFYFFLLVYNDKSSLSGLKNKKRWAKKYKLLGQLRSSQALKEYFLPKFSESKFSGSVLSG